MSTAIMTVWFVACLLLSLSVSGADALSSPSTPPSSSRQQFGQDTTRNVATQVLQGTGPAQVDLNVYNLPGGMEEICQEWTLNLVQKVTEQQAKVKLAAKSMENYVDTVVVTFPRNVESGGGLGLDLIELISREEDGLGITVIKGFVDGGSALLGTAEGDILPGDSIAEVAIVRRRVQRSTGSDQPNTDFEIGIDETLEEFTAKTQGLSYDATVTVLQALPPPLSPTNKQEEDFFRLTLKRIRRKPKVKVNLQFPPQDEQEDVSIELFAGEQLRYGMLVRGVPLNDPLAKRFDTKSSGNCGAGGLCRTCAVSITSSSTPGLLNPQRVAEKQMLQDNPRWRLSCKAIVGYGMKEGEITVRVNPRQW